MATSRQATLFVALLRGINVGGNKKVPMAELRTLCAELGWQDVRTYIQSGNVVFRIAGRATGLAAQLATALEEHFGFAVPVVAQSRDEWLRHAKGSAFPDAEVERPNLLHLGVAEAFAERAPTQAMITALEPYCKADERIAVRGRALWLDYRNGVARSKLTSAVLDRVVGSPVTARNWKSVQAIAALVRAQ